MTLDFYEFRILNMSNKLLQAFKKHLKLSQAHEVIKYMVITATNLEKTVAKLKKEAEALKQEIDQKQKLYESRITSTQK